MSKEELFDCLKRLSKTDNLRDGIDIKKEEANIIVNEIERLNNIIKEVRENVKGIKEINNEVYKQTDMLESFYSRKWCEDITNELLEILDKGVSDKN